MLLDINLLKAALEPVPGQHLEGYRQQVQLPVWGSAMVFRYSNPHSNGELETKQKLHLSDLANGLGADESRKIIDPFQICQILCPR